MLKKYINGTRKKIVATTLALTTTFSAVSFTPYHSYDSTLLKATAIETQNNDEWQTLNNEADALEEEYYALESELEALEQKESSVSENAKLSFEMAVKKLKANIEDVYNNDKYNDIERINKINSAITSLEHQSVMWCRNGTEEQALGISIFQTLIDTFTDNSKDLLDEIFDNSKSLEESKELIEVLINNLCKSVGIIEDLTVKLLDPQNRKAEIKNRMAEIEQRADEIELQLEELGLQPEVTQKETDKNTDKIEDITNKSDESQTSEVEDTDEFDALEEEYYALESELEALEQKEASVSKNAKQSFEMAVAKLKANVDNIYNNDKYDDIEKINEINSAITGLERESLMWGRNGTEEQALGISIFQTLIDIFTDNSKDLLDEIFDNSKSFDESKKLINVLINNLCESVERIEDLTATLIDPQNRKAEIKNRMDEIEQLFEEIE